MNEDNIYGYRFRIKAHKHTSGAWCFGVNLSHNYGETYIYISFFKWGLSIGYMGDF